MACKSRTALTVREDALRLRRATEDAMVKSSGGTFRQMKTVFEASVWRSAPATWLGLLREPGRTPITDWVCPSWARLHHNPILGRPVQPGVEPSTYSIAGFSFEHMNLNPSAGYSEARQTAKSGYVLDEGRSLRCSPSAGEPYTWR